jgi:hypothetical protein
MPSKIKEDLPDLTSRMAIQSQIFDLPNASCLIQQNRRALSPTTPECRYDSEAGRYALITHGTRADKAELELAALYLTVYGLRAR